MIERILFGIIGFAFVVFLFWWASGFRRGYE